MLLRSILGHCHRCCCNVPTTKGNLQLKSSNQGSIIFHISNVHHIRCIQFWMLLFLKWWIYYLFGFGTKNSDIGTKHSFNMFLAATHKLHLISIELCPKVVCNRFWSFEFQFVLCSQFLHYCLGILWYCKIIHISSNIFIYAPNFPHQNVIFCPRGWKPIPDRITKHFSHQLKPDKWLFWLWACYLLLYQILGQRLCKCDSR